MSATIPFEILGHFEEIIDIETGKCYGTRPVDYIVVGSGLPFNEYTARRVFTAPKYGYAGRVEKNFKKGQVIQIDKAHRGMQPFKFKQDCKCWVITHPLCGKMK